MDSQQEEFEKMKTADMDVSGLPIEDMKNPSLSDEIELLDQSKQYQNIPNGNEVIGGPKWEDNDADVGIPVDKQPHNTRTDSVDIISDDLEVKDDGLEYFDPVSYSDIKELKPGEKAGDALIHPVTDSKGLEAFRESYKDLSEEDADALSDEDAATIGLIDNNTESSILEKAMFSEVPTDDDAPVFNGEMIAPRHISVSAKNKEVTGTLAQAVFGQLIGMGGIYQMPLYHSGFSITLKDISNTTILDLQTKLNEDMLALGRTTGGVIFSNYQVRGHRILMDFVLSHLHTSTLDVDAFDLPQYIRLPDLQNVYLLLLKYLYPNGYNAVIMCSESLEQVDKEPKCNFKASVTVDPLKLLRVDKSKLNTAAIRLLAKRKNKSVSIEEVKNYQDTLSALDNEVKEIKTDFGILFLELKTPTAAEYFELGEEWIYSIEDSIEDVIATDDNNERLKLIHVKARQSILNIYLHYVASVRDNNGTVSTSKSDIMEIFEMFTSNEKLSKQIMLTIIDYINTHTLSLVGITSYKCPNCAKMNTGPSTDLGRRVIPLDIFKIAFYLRAIKQKQITELGNQNIF